MKQLLSAALLMICFASCVKSVSKPSTEKAVNSAVRISASGTCIDPNGKPQESDYGIAIDPNDKPLSDNGILIDGNGKP